MRNGSYTFSNFSSDVTAGVVVCLVALPLCLGIALASDAPLFAGLLGGIVGGIIVGFLSGSHTSVSGPAAGLTAVVAAQISSLGSFDAFLLAVVMAGFIQILLGVVRAGFIAAFFPSSVIKGLLAAIGTILILKQIPHLIGHDSDPEGDMAFYQQDKKNTFSELYEALVDLVELDISLAAILVGVFSLILLILWDRTKVLKNSKVPVSLLVTFLGVGCKLLLDWLTGSAEESPWRITESHLVQVPVAKTAKDFLGFLQFPDFSRLNDPAIYTAAITLAAVSSLETLLNIDAVDRIDPEKRVTPASRELVAQGVGNFLVGLIGGLPLTSVVIRGTVNINAGAQSKVSAILHGVLLLVCVMLMPTIINLIPLSCLAAILIVTGVKLVSPAIFKQMWAGGLYQFIPFVVTLVAIVFTDLLIGVLIGLAVSISFILNSNLRRPVRRTIEKHLSGDVLHIELSSQVSFLNKAALERILRAVPKGGQVLIDARNTDYIDPDVLDLLRDFKNEIAPAHGVQVSWRGFRDKYKIFDEIRYVDFSTRELQEKLTPDQVVQILLEGNERFRTGRTLTRDLGRQMLGTAKGQHPLAVVLSCIDSRTPAEIIFDLGLGDIFSVRIAGNVTSPKILGSMEYGCAVAGAKLILVLGHTGCGAVTAAVSFAASGSSAESATGCQHLQPILSEIQASIDPPTCQDFAAKSPEEQALCVDGVARGNVLHTIEKLLQESRALRNLVDEGRIAVVGAIYDLNSGKIDILTTRKQADASFRPVASALAE